MNKDLNRYKSFAKEIKILVRSMGRSNVISKSEIEELIIKYDINLGELGDVDI